MQPTQKNRQPKQMQKKKKYYHDPEGVIYVPKQLALSEIIPSKKVPRKRKNKFSSHNLPKADADLVMDVILRAPSKSEPADTNDELNNKSEEEMQSSKKRQLNQCLTKHYQDSKQVIYVAKKSIVSEIIPSKAISRRKKNKSSNQSLIKADTDLVMGVMLRAPSKSAPVDIKQDLNEKSKEELIDICMKYHRDLQSIQSQISKNLKQTEQEIEFEKQKPNHERKFFVLNEKLILENETMDYKNYLLESLLTKESYNITLLRNTVCSFLNNQGGRIYLGIQDTECEVKGMYLTKKDRDSIQNYRVVWFKDITPDALDLIKVQFIPIKEQKKYSQVPGLFVVKVVIKPGSNTLYSVTPQECKYWIRSGASTIFLRPDMYKKYGEKKLLADNTYDPKNWDDPDLETSLIDMSRLYHLIITIKENIAKREFINFLKSSGISCVIPSDITSNSLVGYFMLEDFCDEVKKYFERSYTIQKVTKFATETPPQMRTLTM